MIDSSDNLAKQLGILAVFIAAIVIMFMIGSAALDCPVSQRSYDKQGYTCESGSEPGPAQSGERTMLDDIMDDFGDPYGNYSGPDLTRPDYSTDD